MQEEETKKESVNEEDNNYERFERVNEAYYEVFMWQDTKPYEYGDNQ